MTESAVHPTRKHIKEHGFRIVTPTARLVRYWWGRISTELWDGALPQPTAIRIRHDRKAWAWIGTPSPGEITLDIDAYPLPKKRLIEVLVHESVHAYLWVAHADSKTVHGPAFMRYRHKVKRTYGLNLNSQIHV